MFKVRHPKGEKSYGGQRVVPIPDDMRPLTTEYLQARETELAKRGVLETVPLVFSLRDRKKHLSVGTMDTWIHQLNHTAGVPRFSPHALRRTYGQVLLDRGVNIETVSVMLGHASTNTTRRHYCRKNVDDARTEVLEAMRRPAPREAEEPSLTPPVGLPGYA